MDKYRVYINYKTECIHEVEAASLGEAMNLAQDIAEKEALYLEADDYLYEVDIITPKPVSIAQFASGLQLDDEEA